MLEKPELFDTQKSFIYTLLVLVSVITVRLFFSYQEYSEFISKPFYFTEASVLNAYEKTKHGKRYTVLKLRSDEGFTFYTTTHKKENFQHQKLRIQIFPSADIAFKDYLGIFYVKSRIKERTALSSTAKDKVLEKVARQHDDPAMQSFYKAILFATPVDKALREKISLLGVSHLVALSGFHLGILWALVYGLFLLAYKPLQQKYFPYRHALLDVGLLTVLVLGAYLWFVDFPPSLLRSYTMLVAGWFVILMGVELLSFKFLTTVVFLLAALFPSLLVSLSFWLSVAGVFYIFLLLHYTKHLSKWLITLLVIPLGIFLLMLPIVHMIFDVTSGYQLLSPLLSLLFIPFYPLVMFLHLIGLGNLLDSTLMALFSLPEESVSHLLPWWLGLPYMGLSLWAVFNQKAFMALLGAASVYAVYLFI